MNGLLSSAAALGSAATLGAADFAGGLASRRTTLPSASLGVEVVGLVWVPLAFWLLPFQFQMEWTVLAFAGGLIGGLGLILFYRAMTLNLIGVVAPITGVVAAALPTMSGVIGGDRLHTGQLVGIGVGLVAIVLINGVGRKMPEGARQGVALAIVAGATFGLFFILFHAGSGAGVYAFAGGRAGSMTSSLIFALVTRVSVIPLRPAWRLIGISGVADGAGVVLYLYATFHGLLSLSALLASFYPAFTVLCARLFTHERMSVVQLMGAALALVAVALIAAT